MPNTGEIARLTSIVEWYAEREVEVSSLATLSQTLPPESVALADRCLRSIAAECAAHFVAMRNLQEEGIPLKKLREQLTKRPVAVSFLCAAMSWKDPEETYVSCSRVRGHVREYCYKYRNASPFRIDRPELETPAQLREEILDCVTSIARSGEKSLNVPESVRGVALSGWMLWKFLEGLESMEEEERKALVSSENVVGSARQALLNQYLLELARFVY